MAGQDDTPTWGQDYDVERWSTGERDSQGNLVWYQDFPEDGEWKDITVITINLDPYSIDGDYVNIVPDPDKPLDPWGRYNDYGQPADWWDLDDEVGQVMDRYEIAY